MGPATAIVALLLGVLLVAAAVGILRGTADADLDRLGVDPRLRPAIAIWQLGLGLALAAGVLAGSGLVVAIAAAGALVTLGGAVAAHLRAGDAAVQTAPAVAGMLLAGAAAARARLT